MSPPRRLRDPRALQAVAHPVRMAIIELLSVEGAMTATQLADRLDESPANCSWHLRKLAEHDFIEEAAGGAGRQRPWQMRHIGMSWAEDDDVTPDELRAGQALSRMLMERWVDRFLDASEREESATWRESAGMSQNVAWLTAEELADLTTRLQEVAGTYAERLATGERPEGARLCEIVAWGAAVEVTR
ncbi:winged helix-turn-helix transcriptional regulator [Nocardioides glacieisoli]|uniref:Winged helix-turn-helix transcriptional regulator n=1 Tax=Nocardioides glacieisoli TaxID=1168730 RepID=A0A4Q2RWH7_9ACTN|nr:helix-turn-helix domain-containing protein [Nocardioides glacieisoli]RYB92305.1 winged helix-turn-helix transcriptional regulator [Nocardioides glacieisoli]